MAIAYLLCEELLVDLAMVHLLLDGPACDQTVNCHLTPLPNAPCPLPGLHVCGRIPIRIIQQHPAAAVTQRFGYLLSVAACIGDLIIHVDKDLEVRAAWQRRVTRPCSIHCPCLALAGRQPESGQQ